MSKETTTFGLSSGKLAQLLSIGSDTDQDKNEMNQEQIKADLLHDRLAVSLPLGPSTVEMLPDIPLGKTIGVLAGDPIGKLLQNPQTDIVVFRKIKDYSKKLSKNAKSETEHVIANTMYYAAIASALVFHKKRITKFSYKDLSHSFNMLSKETWIPSDIRSLFTKASKYCNSKKESYT